MAEKALPGAKYLMLTGIALIVLGAIAIATPAVAGKAVVWVLGAVLLVSGVVQFFHGCREDSWSAKILGVILGVITTFCGLAVLGNKWLGLTALTLVLAIFFVVEGIWKIVASFSFRPAPGWLAMLFSGLLGFLLGFLIWKQWPSSAMWAVGLLVGVDLLVTGLSMVALAITVRGLNKVINEEQAS